MKKRICVFCGSSDEAPEIYKQTARTLGLIMSRRGHTLVFGGGNNGLMGEIGQAMIDGEGVIYREEGELPFADLPYLTGWDAAAERSARIALLREDFDWIVLDVSRNWNDATVRALDLADQILVITSLDVPTLHHAKKHLELLARLGHNEERVQPVVNRRSDMDAVSDKDFTTFLGRAASASIPNDYVHTVNSVNEGRPIFQLAPNSPLASLGRVRQAPNSGSPQARRGRRTPRVPPDQVFLRIRLRAGGLDRRAPV